jgi:hypothetical protein
VARFTGLFAGALIVIYFVVERPYSGMSMNPARTFASAVPALIWTGLWLYFAAPVLGMVLAGEVYLQIFGRVYCAKLHHDNDKRCIFHHGYDKGREGSLVSGSTQPDHCARLDRRPVHGGLTRGGDERRQGDR